MELFRRKNCVLLNRLVSNWDILRYFSFLCVCVLSISSPVYGHDGHHHLNSLIHAERLIFLERELIEFCDHILREEEEMHEYDVHNFTDIYSFLNKTKIIADKNEESSNELSYNPLAMYHTKKRMMQDWPPILEKVEESELITKNSIAGAGYHRLSTILQHEADITESIKDIIWLQKIYNIPVKHIIAGYWSEGHAPAFDVDDIKRFADVARELTDLELSLEFLELSRGMTRSDQDVISYLSDLANTYLTMGSVQKARDTYGELLLKEPGNRIARGNLKLMDIKEKQGSIKEEDPSAGESKTDNTSSLFVDRDPVGALEKIGQYCRGEITQAMKDLNKLKCYDKTLEASNETVKIEELSLFPRLVMIHDLYDEWQMEYLIKRGSKKIWDRLTEPGQQDPCKFLHGKNDDASAYLADDRDTFMDVLVSRLRNVTYQKVTNWKKDKDILAWMIVSNLGAGGKPDPLVIENHMLYTVYDSLRIAHYLTFLNKPTTGGAIVFPDLKVKVEPKPGAALFWQFRTPTGPVQPKFRKYIQCPVVYGTQWVAKSTVEHYDKVSSVRF